MSDNQMSFMQLNMLFADFQTKRHDYTVMVLKNNNEMRASFYKLPEEVMNQMAAEERNLVVEMMNAKRTYEDAFKLFNALNRRKKKKTVIKSRALPRAQASLPCEEECPICSTMHNRSDSCTTQCGHTFGRECYEQWMDHSKQAQGITCPICRFANPDVVFYRERKSNSVKA